MRDRFVACGRLVATLALAAVSFGWLDPHTHAREGNRLFAAGKYDDAAGKYNEALVDEPDSGLLHFNLGDATYKQGKFTDALNAFQQVPTGGADPARAARVAYNTGNTKVRLGEAAEKSDPKAALGLYAEALAAYRRAMGAAPADMDAKFNHEFVEKKIADLKKKLEAQQKQQQEQKDQQQQQEQPKDQEKKPEGQEGQQQPEAQEQQPKEEPQEKEEQQQQAGQEQKDEQQPQGGAQPEAGEKQEGEMSQQEAAALLDSQRDQEVQPDEVTRRLQGAGGGEAAQDW